MIWNQKLNFKKFFHFSILVMKLKNEKWKIFKLVLFLNQNMNYTFSTRIETLISFWNFIWFWKTVLNFSFSFFFKSFEKKYLYFNLVSKNILIFLFFLCMTYHYFCRKHMNVRKILAECMIGHNICCWSFTLKNVMFFSLLRINGGDADSIKRVPLLIEFW